VGVLCAISMEDLARPFATHFMVKATAPMLSLSGLFLRVSGKEAAAELGVEDPDNIESLIRCDFCIRRAVRGLMPLSFNGLRVADKSEMITKQIEFNNCPTRCDLFSLLYRVIEKDGRDLKPL